MIFLMKEKKNIMKYNTEDIYKIIDNEDYLKESKIQYLTEKVRSIRGKDSGKSTASIFKDYTVACRRKK